MEKIPTTKLLEELQGIDNRIEIVPNNNRPAGGFNRQGIANIKIAGVDVCPVPSEYLQTEVTHDYGYVFPNDMRGTFRTYEEAKETVVSYIKRLEDAEFSKEFFERDAD